MNSCSHKVKSTAEMGLDSSKISANSEIWIKKIGISLGGKLADSDLHICIREVLMSSETSLVTAVTDICD